MIYTDASSLSYFVGDPTTWTVQAFAANRFSDGQPTCGTPVPSGVADATATLVRPSTWQLALPTAGPYFIATTDTRGAINWTFVAADVAGQ